MKRCSVWKILCFAGLCPFFAPLVYWLSMNIVHNHYDWTLTDMLFIWSYLYWPTYLIGAVLTAVSVYKIKKAKGE